jgi:tubulin---tyrosine ligase
MESAICVVMEHMGLAHIGEARNAAVRRRMVDVLDESDKLAKSNIVEILRIDRFG